VLDAALKQRIQANEFAIRLLALSQFEEAMFDALCADLQDLAEQWRESTQIDKELASDLVETLIVVRNCAEHLAPERHGPIWDAYIELDRLILEEVFFLPDALRTWIPPPLT
jgi:hypothetical protein